MILKLEITCKSCNCTFQLDSGKYCCKDSLCCPNCGQQIPEDTFNKIADAFNAVKSVPEIFAESNSCNGFQIKPISIDAENEDTLF